MWSHLQVQGRRLGPSLLSQKHPPSTTLTWKERKGEKEEISIIIVLVCYEINNANDNCYNGSVTRFVQQLCWLAYEFHFREESFVLVTMHNDVTVLLIWPIIYHNYHFPKKMVLFWIRFSQWILWIFWLARSGWYYETEPNAMPLVRVLVSKVNLRGARQKGVIWSVAFQHQIWMYKQSPYPDTLLAYNIIPLHTTVLAFIYTFP